MAYEPKSGDLSRTRVFASLHHEYRGREHSGACSAAHDSTETGNSPSAATLCLHRLTPARPSSRWWPKNPSASRRSFARPTSMSRLDGITSGWRLRSSTIWTMSIECWRRCRNPRNTRHDRLGRHSRCCDGIPAWLSGINLYAVVGTLGLLEHFGFAHLPGELGVLGSWPVIGLACTLYLIEFVADKVPVIDSTWDAIHTFHTHTRRSCPRCRGLREF